MEIKETALEALNTAAAVLKDSDLPAVMTQAISSKSDMTWLDVAQTALPIAIESVENSKVVLPANVKASIVTNVVMPLIKDKLPWYVKPFASKLISWFIDVIVGALNKLFTKDWGKEAESVQEKDDLEKQSAGTN